MAWKERKPEQYAKARQLIRKAHRIDTTNEITLRYMHELKQLHVEKAANIKTEKAQTVSYNLGNETIIQPVSSTLKDNAALLTILNIVIGIVVGAAVVWFLAVPTMRKNMNAKTNKEIIVYSEQIAALQSELDLQTKELDNYKAESTATAEQKEIAQATQASYESLITTIEHYNKAGYDRATLAKELLAINTASLGAVGKTTYDAMTTVVFKEQCAKLYPTAKKSYEVVNFPRAIELLENIVAMDEKYQNGEALFMLMDIYRRQGETEKATAKFNRIVELFADTDVAKRASEKMKPTE